MKKGLHFLTGICSMLVLLAVPALAVEPSARSAQDFLRFGLTGSGSARVDETDLDLTGGYAAGLDVDYPISERFRLGWKLSVYGITLEKEFTKKSNPLLSAFLTMKFQLPIGERFFVVPEGDFGYGYLFEFDSQYPRSNYFLEGAGIGLVQYLTPKFGLTAYFGLLWGQGGFGMVRDVSGGPLPILQGGVVIR